MMASRVIRGGLWQGVAVLAAVLLVAACASSNPPPAALPPPPSPLPTASPIPTLLPTSTPTVAPISTLTAAPTPVPAAAPTGTPTLSLIAEGQLAAKIDNHLAALAAQDRFSGAVLVARDGQVILSQGYNLADKEQAAPNTPQTVFRLGSVTKQFTAMAILQLQEMGKLDVQDRVCKVIPNCPQAWQPITIHHLLTHTAGLQDLTHLPTYRDFKQQSLTPAQTIDQFRALPLNFPPGTAWDYSNSGYIVLGYIVELVSGEPYCGFVEKHIAQPLQMANTGCESDHRGNETVAQGYASSTAKADFIDMSVPYAAGGLDSTVEDLYRWDQALSTSKLVPQALLDAMFTPWASMPASIRGKEGYGYGWIIGEQLGRRRIWHGGGIEGFRSEIDRYPDDRATIIVLSNREDLNPQDVTSEIARMMFEAK